MTKVHLLAYLRSADEAAIMVVVRRPMVEMVGRDGGRRALDTVGLGDARTHAPVWWRSLAAVWTIYLHRGTANKKETRINERRTTIEAT